MCLNARSGGSTARTRLSKHGNKPLFKKLPCTLKSTPTMGGQRGQRRTVSNMFKPGHEKLGVAVPKHAGWYSRTRLLVDSDVCAILWQSKNSKILQEHTRTVKNSQEPPPAVVFVPLVQGSDTESTKNYKYSTALFEAPVGHNP